MEGRWDERSLSETNVKALKDPIGVFFFAMCSGFRCCNGICKRNTIQFAFEINRFSMIARIWLAMVALGPFIDLIIVPSGAMIST